ncbi:hypothetical protein N2152v2_006806 [Parachlorella kessleri]
MANNDTLTPLLDEGWDQLDHVEEQVSEHCNVASLLREHPHDVVRYIQSKGVAKLGEFCAKDSLVFPAFARDPLLAMGSDSRNIDFEREWKKVMKTSAKTEETKGWSTEVELEAFVVTIRHAAAPDKSGLLQPLLKRWQGRRCTYSVFALPAVQGVITWKWNAFARRMLLAELAFFVLWLVAFNTFTIAFQAGGRRGWQRIEDENLSLSLKELLRTPRGKLELAAHALALVGMTPFLLLEMGTIPAYGIFGWLDAWNVLDICTYTIQFIGSSICQPVAGHGALAMPVSLFAWVIIQVAGSRSQPWITVTVMHLARINLHGCWLTVLPAAQCILLMFRLQYYSQVFRPTRFAFLDTIAEVFRDLRWYLVFLLLVMWGFGCAFHIVFRHDQEESEEFDTILHAFLSMFEHQYGDIEMGKMYKSKNPITATILNVCYTVVMGLILINLLIGIVLNSLEKATEHQDVKMLLSKARIIDELEATMPAWLEKRNPHWYPAYVHLLRINPNKLDQVEVDALWSQMGEDSPPITQPGGGGGGDGGNSGGGEEPLTSETKPPEVAEPGDWGEAEGHSKKPSQQQQQCAKDDGANGPGTPAAGAEGRSDGPGGDGGASGDGRADPGDSGGNAGGLGSAGAVVAADWAGQQQSPATDVLLARLDAMQRQLEEQGQLLRRVCGQLAAEGPGQLAAEE